MSDVDRLAINISKILTRSDSSTEEKVGDCGLRNGALVTSHISPEVKVRYSSGQKHNMKTACLVNGNTPVQKFLIKFDSFNRPSMVMVFRDVGTDTPTHIIKYPYDENGKAVAPEFIEGEDNLTPDQKIILGRIRIDYLTYPPSA